MSSPDEHRLRTMLLVSFVVALLAMLSGAAVIAINEDGKLGSIMILLGLLLAAGGPALGLHHPSSTPQPFAVNLILYGAVALAGIGLGIALRFL